MGFELFWLHLLHCSMMINDGVPATDSVMASIVKFQIHAKNLIKIGLKLDLYQTFFEKDRELILIHVSETQQLVWAFPASI